MRSEGYHHEQTALIIISPRITNVRTVLGDPLSDSRKLDDFHTGARPTFHPGRSDTARTRGAVRHLLDPLYPIPVAPSPWLETASPSGLPTSGPHNFIRFSDTLRAPSPRFDSPSLVIPLPTGPSGAIKSQLLARIRSIDSIFFFLLLFKPIGVSTKLRKLMGLHAPQPN